MSLRKWLYRRKRDLRYPISSLEVMRKGYRKRSREVLFSVKNKYKDQRCFIVGNGPSLKPEDLDRLKDEITFATNRIYKIFDKTDWRPTYFAMFDETVGDSEGVSENVSRIDCLKFVREQGYYTYKNIKGDVCFVHSRHGRKYLDNPKFSDNLTKYVYTIASVTYTAIQLARWMGFDKIYLLGMDNRYAYSRLRDGTIVRNEGVVSYFMDNEQTLPDPTTAVPTWELDVAFEYADKYSREHGFRIYNATRGGFLEAFERVNLDEVLRQ